MERRTVDGSLELRDAQDDEGGRSIAGLAAVYYDGSDRTEFPLWEGVVERILPGALDESAAADDVRALFNHDSNLVLGRTSAGTLKLTATKSGLDFETTPSDTTIYRDVSEHLHRGDVTGSSFAFRVAEGGDDWSSDEGRGLIVREIKKAKLYDVGPVTYPAYEATEAGLRRADEIEDAKQSWERRKKASDAEQRKRDCDRQRQAEVEVTIG